METTDQGFFPLRARWQTFASTQANSPNSRPYLCMVASVTCVRGSGKTNRSANGQELGSGAGSLGLNPGSDTDNVRDLGQMI